jgi:DNA-binding Xre family transcriptional regulator
MTKMRKNEEVSMTVLNKICAVLNVNYGDIVEYIPTENTEGEVQE